MTSPGEQLTATAAGDADREQLTATAAGDADRE